MTLDEYQQLAMRTAGPTALNAGLTEGLTLSALGLCGESGEFADIVKKLIYHAHPFNKRNLVGELGDILWYVARACVVLGVTLEYVAGENIEKLRLRYPEGFSSERSINRGDS